MRPPVDRTWSGDPEDEVVDAEPATGPRYAPTGTELGRGGLGRVDEVLDARLGREVARKRLLVDQPDRRRRFLREARVTAQLEHPSIVPVYDVDTDADGLPFYTMRRVRGQTLGSAARAGDGPLVRLRLVAHVVDACHAVAYAHARGVLHRDLKPDNVMVGEFGETWVVDWGLAKLSDEPAPTARPVAPAGDAHTRDGVVLGSPWYMSPEQAAGAPVDARSDVWGLGMCLLEVLIGGPVYQQPDGARLIDEVGEGRRPAAVAHAPRDLLAVAGRALRVRPADRYPSATEMAEDLEAWQAGGRVSAYRYSRTERALAFARRHRSVVGPAAAVVAGIVALATVGLAAFAIHAETERTRAVAAERAARRENAASLTALAPTDADQGLVDDARKRLDLAAATLRDLEEPTDPVDLVRAWLHHRNPPPVARFPANGVFAQAAISSSGERAAVGGDGVVWLCELPTGRIERAIAFPGARVTPQFVGERLYVHRLVDERSAVVDEDGRVVVERDSAREHTVFARPAGIWWSDATDGAALLDLATGAPLGPRVPEAQRLFDVDATGSRLLGYPVQGSVYRFPDELVVWRADGTRAIELPGATLAALAPSGAAAASVGRGRMVVRTEGGRGWEVEDPGLRWVAFESDDTVVGGLSSGETHRWSVRDGVELPVTPLLGAVIALGPTAESAIVARGPSIDVVVGRPLDRLAPRITVGTDGSWMIVTSWTGDVVIVDWRSGFVLRSWAVSPAGVRDASLSEDGRWLLTADREGHVRGWDLLASGGPALDLASPGIALAARFVDDDRHVVAVFDSGRMVEWDRADGRERWSTDLGLMAFSARTAGDDETWVISGRGDLDPEWVVFDRAERRITRSGRAGAAFGVVAATDGSGVFVSSARAPLWVDPATGAEQVWPAATTYSMVAIDGANERVAIGTNDGNVLLHAVPDGALLGRFPVHDRSLVALAFAGDVLLSLDTDGELQRLDLAPPVDPPMGTEIDRRLASARRLAALGDAAGAVRQYAAAIGAGAAVDPMEHVRALAAAGRRSELAALPPEDAGTSPITLALWRAALDE